MNTLAIEIRMPVAESVFVTDDTLSVNLNMVEQFQFLRLGIPVCCMQIRRKETNGG